MNSTTPHIVLLGESGFPDGMASIQRFILLGKALIHGGCKVLVLCRKGTSNPMQPPPYPAEGNFQGIDYHYTTGSVLRPGGFVGRNFQKIKGMLREYQMLRTLKKDNKLDAAVISTMSSIHLLRYRLISRLIGFPIILNYVEYATAMKHRNSLSQRINDSVFDSWAFRTVDGALPISEFLVDRFRKYCPDKPVLKLPIICDFDEFDIETEEANETALLYCGAASYTELIEFVIAAFDAIDEVPEHVFLHFVSGGSKEAISRLEALISRSKRPEKIRLFPNIPREEIPVKFASAEALLIPMRPTLQDEARFPHKIGEYLASGSPLITTAYGEINKYDFIDGQTALVADEYDILAYSQKMKFIIAHPHRAKEIGAAGREMGFSNFSYTAHGQRLRAFFSSLMKGTGNA